MVVGLFTYVKDKEVYEIIDLVKEAKEKGGIEILVDFRAFHLYLSDLITRKIVYDHKNNFLLFPGGEFDILYKAFYDFQKAFESVDIKLVWIIDGPNGLDVDGSAQKNETIIKREKARIKKYDEILNGCSSELPPSNLNKVEPLCRREVSIDALKKAGAEVIQLLQGEADDFIAYEFHRRKSFAIITNDTDFLIFENCRVIFQDLMTTYYQYYYNIPFVNKDKTEEIFISPKNLFCQTITTKSILDLFRFDRSDQLISLSILIGNDYTYDFAQPLLQHLDIKSSSKKHSNIIQMAEFIKKNKITMENINLHPIIERFIENNPEFGISIKFCNDFYSLTRIKESLQNIIYYPNHFTNKLTDYLAQKFSSSELNKEIYSNHFGKNRVKIYLESPNDSCQSISIIMAKMIEIIYPYVLIERESEVVEWRPRDSKEVRVPVTHSTLTLNERISDNKGNIENDPGLDLFDKIWSHLEPNGSLKYFPQFGIERGFICYILRYLYQITKNKNLNLSTEEFQALFVTVFYNYSISQKIIFKTKWTRNTFLYLKICPTEKCLIINSWFLCLFHWSKYCCGGFFNLKDKFPEIQNLFNASIFYAFYEYLVNDFKKRTDHLGNDFGRKDFIQLLLDIIMEKYDVEYQIITK